MLDRRLPAGLALGGLLVLAAACSESEAARPAGDQRGATTSATPSASASPSPTSAPAVDPASVKANELGLVPVLMYHQIVAQPRDVYDQTPAEFRAELELLARQDYVPITAADLVARKIDIPAGKHPVVLTFDDSTASQLTLGADGKPARDTAVAILEEVAARHPGFTATATFYVNEHPFNDSSGKALRWLHEHGYEVGVHTTTHANLRQLSAAAAQQEIGGNVAMIEKMIPGYRPTTIALPFGIFPTDVALAHKGSGGGASYDLAGVMLVGSNPSHSPFHKAFDPYNVPRIRSGDVRLQPAADKPFVSAAYLADLQRNPAKRYTSDGDPAKVSFPKSFADVLAPAVRGQANPY